MDSISDPLLPSVCVKSSAQVGKTLLLKAIIGYFVDQDPSPILMVQPNIEMGETFSKDRLAPMIRDTPCLRGKIADPKSRDSGNTILHKRFPGGHLTIVGANAPAGLASRPVRVVLFDEVDRYPASAGTEGDPITLGKARTKTFWNRKIVMVSTPGEEETSRIEKAWLASDQRHYHVDCPYCCAAQPLRWANVKWDDGDAQTARYRCDECDNDWSDGERVEALRSGRWIATHPERRDAGFHLNELCSPFRRLSEIVEDFLAAKGAPETLKSWVNTSLGECWQDRGGEKVDAVALRSRVEPYTEPPSAACLVTLYFDVQDDRLEYEFVAWGEGDECWGLDYGRLEGDPGRSELWLRAEDQIARTFRRADGAVLAVATAGIDSGGHYTSQVYAFCKKHRGRVFATKGHGGQGRPMIEVSDAPLKKHGVKLHNIGTDTAKDLLLLSRVKIVEPGPGYCHWPAHYPRDYFDQLTVEKRIVKYHMGRPYHSWVCPKHKRNEALDIRVGHLALIHLMRPNYAALAERLKPEYVAPKPQVRQGRGTRSTGVSI